MVESPELMSFSSARHFLYDGRRRHKEDRRVNMSDTEVATEKGFQVSPILTFMNMITFRSETYMSWDPVH